MEIENPELQSMLVELTRHLRESFDTDVPYRKVRQKLLIELAVHADKRILRFYLDRIAVELLGKSTAYSEIIMDEQRIKEEGEKPTYPLYLGLHPGWQLN
jgi:hypothetical protein